MPVRHNEHGWWLPGLPSANAAEDRFVVRVEAPDGMKVEVEAEPLGVTSYAWMQWPVGWIWHVIRHRGDWHVVVLRRLDRRDLKSRRVQPRMLWASETMRRGEARALARRLARRIQDGRWVPGGTSD
jgi:hypothetical protein